MAENNHPSEKGLFDWTVFFLFVVFFGSAWAIIQGLHYYIDQWRYFFIDAGAINNVLKDGPRTIGFSHHWLSEWFIIILTSYLVSLLTMFVGNAIDLKNSNRETDDNETGRKRKRLPSASYEVAVFALGVSVLVSVAVVVVGEACKLTGVSEAHLLQVMPDKFLGEHSIIRQIALFVAGFGSDAANGNSLTLSPMFVWCYLGLLLIGFLWLLFLCTRAGIRIWRAANEVEVTWEENARRAAKDSKTTWETLQRRVNSAIAGATNLAAWIGSEAGTLAQRIGEIDGQIKRAEDRRDALTALSEAVKELENVMAPHGTVAEGLALETLHGHAVKVHNAIPEGEDVLAVQRSSIAAIVEGIEAEITARTQPSDGEGDTATNETTEAPTTKGEHKPSDTFVTDIAAKLHDVCISLLAVVPGLVGEIVHEIEGLTKKRAPLADHAAKHDNALVTLTGKKSGDGEGASSVAENLPGSAPLLENLKLSVPHIATHTKRYERVEEGKEFLRFNHGRLEIGESDELVLVRGSYKTEKPLDDTKFKVERFALWLFVAAALAANNFIIAPSVPNEALGLVDPLFANYLPAFIIGAFFLLPFIFVTLVPPCLVYRAAQRVLPANNDPEYRSEAKAGVARFIVSGGLGIATVLTIAILVGGLKIGYSLWIEPPKPPLPPPVAEIVIHPVPVYCAMTKVAGAAKQANWVYAADLDVEATATDCRLLEPLEGFNYVVVVGAASQEEALPNATREDSEDARAYRRAELLAGVLAERLPDGLKEQVYSLGLGKHPQTSPAALPPGANTADQRQTLVLVGRTIDPPTVEKVRQLLSDYFSGKTKWQKDDPQLPAINAGQFCPESCKLAEHDGRKVPPEEPVCGFSAEIYNKHFGSSETVKKLCPPAKP